MLYLKEFAKCILKTSKELVNSFISIRKHSCLVNPSWPAASLTRPVYGDNSLCELSNLGLRPQIGIYLLRYAHAPRGLVCDITSFSNKETDMKKKMRAIFSHESHVAWTLMVAFPFQFI